MHKVFLFLISVVFLSVPVMAGSGIPLYSSASRINFENWIVSHGWSNGEHQSCEWRKNAVDMTDFVLTMTLSDKGGELRDIGCGEIQSKERFGYGRYEARMKTAVGSGLNTAFFTYIGPGVKEPEHDEIDFEFLGAHPGTVDVTHWTNGKVHEAKRVELGFDPSQEFHDYAFEWSKDKIIWYVDGEKVHESAADHEIPRNEQKIYFSLWSGGKSVNDWLGPFRYKGPVSAEVEWVKFTPMSDMKAKQEP